MLRFCFGPSGAGKSTLLYREVIEESARFPGTEYWIIVPDQFTMQAQRDVLRLHPRHAISNIDVLSFSRLRHKIFDEVGTPGVPVLDDMGKTLVLRHVAEEIRGELGVLGGKLALPGFIDEVKSVLSEFMQYRVSPEDLDLLIGACGWKGQLAERLKDLQRVYRAFLEAMGGRYATTEQTMELLAQAICRSARMKDAVVVFDGFTGFTPIQYHVLSSILRTAARVTVSLPAEPGTDPFDAGAESIFSLTAKTVADLERAAFLAESPDAGADRAAQEAFCAHRRRTAGDLFLRERPVARLADNPPLAFFEERIFREEGAHYAGEAGEAIRLVEAPDPAGECAECCLRILSYIGASETRRFEDIAVLSTDLSVYGPLMERISGRFGIPVYIDETAGVRMNPLTECVSGAIQILTEGFSAASVFRFLRSGLTDLTAREIDRLQLYTEALGIRGRRRYEEEFTRLPERLLAGDEKTAYLDRMNAARSRLVSHLARFPRGTGCEVKAFSDALLGMLSDLRVRDKLEAMAGECRAQGDERGCRELTQIYGKLVELVEQMKALFGDGRITIREYGELLQVGIDKITIGMLPAGIDRVMIGDLERTRLGGKRVLFLLGANDSRLPGNTGGGGILNEMDRRFLAMAGTGVELAPDPVRRLSYERQYLYMNLTLPSGSLILSWSLSSQDGAPERPADLIRRIRELFPGVRTERAADRTLAGRIGSRENASYLAAELFRLYADGRMKERERTEFLALVAAVADGGADHAARMRRLADAAFCRYVPQSVSPDAAGRIYGGITENSVSRLETFAGCPFAHFARYGLRLAETERYEVDHTDLGVLYHGALSEMDAALRRQGRDLTDLSDGEAAVLAQSVLRDQAAVYRNGILLSNMRYQFMLRRLTRTLVRTVHTIRYQLSKGVFRPFASELEFTEGDGQMLLKGRIDRLDTYDDRLARYLRVIDYKSGRQVWDPNLYTAGISLQLMVYLRAVLGEERDRDPERLIVPAGVFYYHIGDPILTQKNESITSDIEKERIEALALTGVANSDRRILAMMDRSLDGEGGAKSDVLPVKLKKDGTPDANSHRLSTEEFDLVSRYTDHQIRTLGGRIRDGETAVRPYRYKQMSACSRCGYRGICGFDPRIAGYDTRDIAVCGREELLEHMRKQLHE